VVRPRNLSRSCGKIYGTEHWALACCLEYNFIMHFQRALALLTFMLVFSAIEAKVFDSFSSTWIDEKGRKVHLSDWNNKKVILSMIYTSCKRTCPVTLQVLKNIQKEMTEKKENYEFLVITLDPTQDDPETLKKFKESKANFNNWHFLWGEEKDLNEVGRKLGFEFYEDTGHIVHDLRILAIDESGKIVTTLTWDTRNTKKLFN
jgi:cytochrome oxidase Cu insertion factor (SCO1/SenC/PrrC family)